MKLWLFTCTDAGRKIVTARIAAEDRAAALAIVRKGLEGAGGITAFFGEDHRIREPGIVSIVEARP